MPWRAGRRALKPANFRMARDPHRDSHFPPVARSCHTSSDSGQWRSAVQKSRSEEFPRG